MPTPEHILRMPVTGIEAELAVFVDGERVDPARVWTSPSLLMGPAAVETSGPAAPLAGGGVVYFDDGVAEIVTPSSSWGRERRRGRCATCGKGWEGSPTV